MSNILIMSTTKRRRTNVYENNNKKRCAGWSHTIGFHERIIMECQEKLKRIYNNQDDRIRQLFHLENYTTLLDYDPQVAKHDKSNEFIQVIIFNCKVFNSLFL